MSDENQAKDELVRDSLNVSGVRNDWGYPDVEPAKLSLDFSDLPTEADLQMGVNAGPFSCYLMPLPPDMPDEDVAKVRQFIKSLANRPKPVAVARPEPEPETDDEKRERFFGSAIEQYAHAATLYALQVCSRRDNAGRPIPTTPAETSLLMAENRRLMEQLVQNTRDFGYSPEEIYSAASEAERQVATSIIQEAKPYVPDESLAIQAFYTNHRGESSVRRIIPIGLWRGCTEYHPQEQHLLDVWDLDKGEKRTYALAGFPGVIVPETRKDGVDNREVGSPPESSTPSS